MTLPKSTACALVCMLGALSACSKTTGDSATAIAASTSPPQAKPGNVCERKLLTAKDVAGILSEPVTGTKPLKGDTQTCYFITADDDNGGPNLMVSLRPGLGIATIATFASGKMDAYAKWVPLAGIGDGAVWKPDLLEVTAQKNNILCEVRPSPLSVSTEFAHAGQAAQQHRLGALCNKIFAAY